RRKGLGSDTDMPLSKSPPPKPADSPTPRKAAPGEGGAGEVFDFSLSVEDSDQVEIGQELSLESPSSKKASPGGRKPGSPKPAAPKSGSDSDVRLIADGSDLEFQIASDSDVKMIEEPAPAASGSAARKATPKPEQPDSGVRLIPLDEPSDSDVKI